MGITTTIGKNGIVLLNNLINENHDGIHQYIIDCFWLYRQQKKKVTLTPRHLNKGKLSDLIMNNVHDYNSECDEPMENENDNVNLPKPIIFDLFPNMEEVVIYTAYGTGRPGLVKYPQYKISMTGWLSLIDCAKSSIVFRIYSWRECTSFGRFGGETWL